MLISKKKKKNYETHCIKTFITQKNKFLFSEKPKCSGTGAWEHGGRNCKLGAQIPSEGSLSVLSGPHYQAEGISILASEHRCAPWEWVSETQRLGLAQLKDRRTVAAVCVCGCVWGEWGPNFLNFFLFLFPPGPVGTMLCLCRGAPTDNGYA